MSVPKGKITAVVGASGSGKSTLLKLILGYYPPLSGTIDIAGVDIREYSPRWWRSQCGVVMQNGYIFSESIERNIAADDSEIDRAKLDYAARVANIYDFIQTLPLKYLTKSETRASDSARAKNSASLSHAPYIVRLNT